MYKRQTLRRNDKKEEIKKVVDMDIDKWLESLPLNEKATASKLVDTCLLYTSRCV